MLTPSRVLAIFLIFVWNVCAQSPSFPPYFTITDLGILPGMESSTATGISSTGIVSGYSSPTTSGAEGIRGKGFLYSNGTMTPVQKAGDTFTVPIAVNAAGTAVGLTGDYSNKRLTPFVYQNGQFLIPTNLPYDASGKSITLLTGITDTGMMVGNTAPAHSGGGETQAFVFNSGAVVTLPFAFATAIANNGDVSGWNGTAANPGNLQGIYWNGGSALTFGAANFGCSSQSPCNAPVQAFAVSSGHAVAIRYDNQSWIPSEGCIFPLVVPGSAWCAAAGNVYTGINSQQWIVGMNGREGSPSFVTSGISADIFASDANVLGALFAWPFSKYFAPGTSFGPFLTVAPPASDPQLRANGAQLSELIVNGAGWQLNYVAGINDAGQIVGTGFHNGHQRAFILTPGASAPTRPFIYNIEGAGLSMPAVTSITTGGWFSIFGSDFQPPTFLQNELASSPPGTNTVLSTNLSQVCVEVNGLKAPLSFVSPGQINAQAPANLNGDTATVSVVANCGAVNEIASAPLTVPAAAAAPELLYFQTNNDGQNPVAAVTRTGRLVGFQGGPPANAGDTLVIYAVGLGTTTPPQTPGVAATTAATVNGSVSVTIGGINALVSYAGVSPGSAGLYQVNLVVPPGTPPGNQPIVVRVNDTTSPAGAYITIQ